MACDISLGPDCDSDERNRHLYFTSGQDGRQVAVAGTIGLELQYGFSAGSSNSCILNVTSQATWVSSNIEVVEIGEVVNSESGSFRIIRGVRVGTAMVTARYRGQSATQHVTVIEN